MMADLMEKNEVRTINMNVACAFGVPEAMLLNQIHYWINKKKEKKDEHNSSFRDGRWWVYNTYRGWREQLPCYSEMTIRRALLHLTDIGVIVKGNYNKLAYDNTNWYTIDYEILEKYMAEEKPSDQIDQTPDQNDQMDVVKMSRPIPKTTHCTSPKNTSESNRVGKLKNLPDTTHEKFSFGVLDRQIRKVCKDTDNEKYTDAVIYLFHLYYEYYWIITHHDHKRLNDKNIMDAIDKLHDHYMPSDEEEVKLYYRDYIQDYFFGNNNFTGNEKGECDYSILHFLSTLEYRAYNTEYI